MDTHALPRTGFHSWRRLLVVAAVVLALVVIGTAIGLFVWLRSYAPLVQGSVWGGGPPYGHMVEPIPGSGGTEVFFIKNRRDGLYRVRLSVQNRGRFTVALLGPASGQSIFAPVAMRATAEGSPMSEAPHFYVGPVNHRHPLSLKPGDERSFEVTYRVGARCIGGQPKRYWPRPLGSSVEGTNEIALRIKYAHVFERTQRVPTPFAPVFACNNGTRPTG